MGEKDFNPEEESLFDLLRRQANHQMSDDFFEGTNLVLCKVLKVFSIVPKGRWRWIDKAFGEHQIGDKKQIFGFKGRIVSKDDGLTIHSSLPDPESYGTGLGNLPAADPTAAEAKMLWGAGGPNHGFIDMHPTFLGSSPTGVNGLGIGRKARGSPVFAG